MIRKQDIKLDVGARCAFQNPGSVAGKLCGDLSLHQRIQGIGYVGYHYHAEGNAKLQAVGLYVF